MTHLKTIYNTSLLFAVTLECMVMRLRVPFHLTVMIDIVVDQQGFSLIHDREPKYYVCVCARARAREPRLMMRGEYVLILVVVKGRKEGE
jgi:hypothetical protein